MTDVLKVGNQSDRTKAADEIERLRAELAASQERERSAYARGFDIALALAEGNPGNAPCIWWQDEKRWVSPSAIAGAAAIRALKGGAE